MVPSSFTIQHLDNTSPDAEIITRKITIDEDLDEADGSTGQPATQKTEIYPVRLGDTVVRLIDTPGIGDTRRIEKDKENMTDILAMLCNFEKLHGIIILMKGSNARPPVAFRCVMAELLTHWHRDAIGSMVFGFTNTQSSNYAPGDTLEQLRSLLSTQYGQSGIALGAETVYCFDSESFKFLAAQRYR